MEKGRPHDGGGWSSSGEACHFLSDVNENGLGFFLFQESGKFSGKGKNWFL